MKKKLQWILICSLFFVLGSYSNIISKADTSLQSTGKIVVTNPETGQTEILFDSADQEKLKNDITANSIDINELKDFKDYQYEQNSNFRERLSNNLERTGDALTALGGFSFHENPTVIALVVDNSIYKDDNGKYVLADTNKGRSLLLPYRLAPSRLHN